MYNFSFFQDRLNDPNNPDWVPSIFSTRRHCRKYQWKQKLNETEALEELNREETRVDSRHE
jgi:hypothetical protein